MKLYYSTASPFVRKVMVVAKETGLDARIETETVAVNPTQPNAALARSNPLMKLPTLITDEGMVLYESSLICQYLDTLHGGRRLVPENGAERWRVLRLEALADGITDAGILVRYEQILRSEAQRSQSWVDGQLTKVNNGLDMLEKNPQELSGELNLGQIAVACAIGWLEFRNPAGDLRAHRPQLFAWYESFSQRPALMATAPRA